MARRTSSTLSADDTRRPISDAIAPSVEVRWRVAKTPEPCRASTSPSAASAAIASRTTVRLTPNCVVSCDSVGSLWPGSIAPAIRSSRSVSTMRADSLVRGVVCMVAISASPEQTWQPERNLRHVRDEPEDDEPRAAERPDTSHGLPDRNLSHRAGDELHRANRRRVEADAEVEDEDHAEMHRVDAVVLNHRQEDRRADDDHRPHVHEGAEQQHQDIEQQQDYQRILRDVVEDIDQCRWDAQIG